MVSRECYIAHSGGNACSLFVCIRLFKITCHYLILGFESILEGIYGPRLLRDLSIFEGESICMLHVL